MSGIALLFHRDGRPVTPADTDLLLEACTLRGSDGASCVGEGSAAVMHALMATGRQAVAVAPARSADLRLVLTLDGRLDNREELAELLECSPRELQPMTDADLLLRAYQRWGVDGLSRVVGDYAFALWDRLEGRVVCARDPLGQRPLYYFALPALFIGASSVRGLLAHPSVPWDVNEGVVAEYLAGSITTVEETLFAGIRRVPPGSWLVVDKLGIRRGSIDWIDPAHTIRYRHEQEYAEHLRGLVSESVRARVGDVPEVGCELSGGLDSSMVTGITLEVLRTRGSGQLTTLSLVFPGLACDEQYAIDRCLSDWQIPSDVVVASDPPTPDLQADERHLDFPYHPNGTMSVDLRRRARARGTRVVLTGIGGDEWFTGSRFHHADNLRAARIGRVAGHAWGDATRHGGMTRAWNAVAWNGVWPLLPTRIKAPLRRVAGRRGVNAPWLQPALIQRTSLADRLRALPAAPDFPTFAQRDMWAVAFGGWSVHGAEMEDRLAADLRIELRHPLSDVRIARFGLAIPEEQRWRGAERKRVLRAAAAGVVPEAIRLRHDKPDFSPLVVRALQAHGGERMWRSLAIVERGWVDAAPLETMYRNMLAEYANGNARYMAPAWTLWMMCGIERWMRAVARSVPRVRERATA